MKINEKDGEIKWNNKKDNYEYKNTNRQVLLMLIKKFNNQLLIISNI